MQQKHKLTCMSITLNKITPEHSQLNELLFLFLFELHCLISFPW